MNYKIILFFYHNIKKHILENKTFNLYNSNWFQKKWVKRTLKKKSLEYSYSWGNPDKNDDKFGNYLKIKNDYLIPNIKDKIVLELGCLDGKWSQFIVPNARETILVDLDKSITPMLNKRLGNSNYFFYETKGYELKGIKDNSVDFIFSMDTLVRVRKNFIKKYFSEFNRVLRKDGMLLLHLPCNTSEMSVKRGFTDLSQSEISGFLKRENFQNFKFDFTIINHGVLIICNKTN